MMLSKYCPLCNSHKIKLLEKINTSDIECNYELKYDIKTKLSERNIYYYNCETCELLFFLPMEGGGEDFYTQLQKFEWYYSDNKNEFFIAKKFISAGNVILDVGSGKGAFSKIISNCSYHGLEFNDLAIEKAKNENIFLKKETVEEHAKNNFNKYDVVVSFQVLEHISSPYTFIQASVNCLKIGGYLIISVPNNDGICGITQNFLLNMPPHHLTRWTHNTLCKLACVFNLELVAIESEKLQSHHNRWSSKAIWENKIRNAFFFKPKLLDTSIKSRFVSVLSMFLSIIIPRKNAKILGHTIVAVYRKIK